MKNEALNNKKKKTMFRVGLASILSTLFFWGYFGFHLTPDLLTGLGLGACLIFLSFQIQSDSNYATVSENRQDKNLEIFLRKRIVVALVIGVPTNIALIRGFRESPVLGLLIELAFSVSVFALVTFLYRREVKRTE
jgi:hypothetical protein